VAETAVLKSTSDVEEAPLTTPDNEEVKISIIQALIGIVIRPVSTFQRLQDSKRGYWWLVLAITLVILILSALASANVTSRAIRTFSSLSANPTVITGDQAAAAQQFQSPSLLLLIALPLVGGLLLTLADYFLRSLIVFAMSLVLGGKATFKQAFRMSVWTTIPYAFRHIVQSIAMFATGGQAVSGLSAILTTAESRAIPILNYVLSYIDFYMLWSAILLGIGTVITAKISKGKGLAVMVAYLGIALAGALILFAISSALGGVLGGGAGLRRFPGSGRIP
jgi:hypothetical protein